MLYYIVTWEFDLKGNPSPNTIAEQRVVAEQINIPDTYSNNNILIKQKEINEAHKKH
jgi:hypothetical protein